MSGQAARYVKTQEPEVIRIMVGPDKFEDEIPPVYAVDEVGNLISSMENKLTLLGKDNINNTLDVSYASRSSRGNAAESFD